MYLHPKCVTCGGPVDLSKRCGMAPSSDGSLSVFHLHCNPPSGPEPAVPACAWCGLPLDAFAATGPIARDANYHDDCHRLVSAARSALANRPHPQPIPSASTRPNVRPDLAASVDRDDKDGDT